MSHVTKKSEIICQFLVDTTHNNGEIQIGPHILNNTYCFNRTLAASIQYFGGEMKKLNNHRLTFQPIIRKDPGPGVFLE